MRNYSNKVLEEKIQESGTSGEIIVIRYFQRNYSN